MEEEQLDQIRFDLHSITFRVGHINPELPANGWTFFRLMQAGSTLRDLRETLDLEDEFTAYRIAKAIIGILQLCAEDKGLSLERLIRRL